MSNYGADENPSIPAAQDLAFTKNFLPQGKPLVEQWTYLDGKVVRKLASKIDKSNVLFRLGGPGFEPPEPPPLDPVPAGDSCTVCWGNGKPFGVGETPDTVVVVIAGVEKGPGWMAGDGEPPNGTFDLEQLGGFPCRFIFQDDDRIVQIIFGPAAGVFQVINKPIFLQSFFAIGSECQTFFTNTVTNEFVGGTATIYIPPII